MRLRLYRDSRPECKNSPGNSGCANVLVLLDELEETVKAQVEIISTTGWSDEQGWEVYSEACASAV